MCGPSFMGRFQVKHLLVYVDGNRRWAARHKLSVRQGYWAAAYRLMPLLDYCLDKKIPYVSLYAASTENIRKRSAENKDSFYEVTVAYFSSALSEFLTRGVKVSFVGNLELLPEFVRDCFFRIAQATAHGNALSFSFLFSYGGVEEIIMGVKKILYDIDIGIISAHQAAVLLDYDFLKEHMWLARVPEPDLIIRPAGGYQRLSNGPLFHAAYTEFLFLAEHWPEVDAQLLEECLGLFSQQTRNFGV